MDLFIYSFHTSFLLGSDSYFKYLSATFVVMMPLSSTWTFFLFQTQLPIIIVTPRISINIMRTVTVIFLRYAG